MSERTHRIETCTDCGREGVRQGDTILPPATVVLETGTLLGHRGDDLLCERCADVSDARPLTSPSALDR